MQKGIYQQIIGNYIKAYNRFDIEGMLADMHENIVFENISNGEVTLTTKGITQLKNQAEQAGQYFKEREQRITKVEYMGDIVEIDIEYKAILAVDLPNGLKAGDKLELTGKSIFRFKDHKIIELKDIS
jgi:ketosteroid isomerase-like protein